MSNEWAREPTGEGAREAEGNRVAHVRGIKTNSEEEVPAHASHYYYYYYCCFCIK